MWATLKILIVVSSLFLVNSSADADSSLNLNKERYSWGSYFKEVGPPSQRPLRRVTSIRFPSRHPLDPLTADEIRATAKIIRNYTCGKNFTFNTITLQEPRKSELLPYFLKDQIPPEGAIPRKAFVILIDRRSGRTYEVTVNIDTKQIEKFISAPNDAQPRLTIDEMNDAREIMIRDPECIKRINRLGWTDMNLVAADVWSMAYIEDRPEYQGRRVIQVYAYGRNFEEDNQYAHPFDFVPIIDLNERKVIAIEELPTHDDFDTSNKRGNNVPKAESNYDPEFRDPNSFREDLNPVNVSQPGGKSFHVRGHEISWQKFKFRLGFNGREGAFIHTVSYKDGEEVRPLFYRLSLAELFIPYGDPRPPYHRKHVFDEGQYGNGDLSLTLEAGKDCVGEIHFFDSVLHNDRGEVVRRPNAICVHEEDAGILWKHTDFRTGRNVAVRSQRLAVTSVVTAGNYDYIFSWHFYMDGTVEFSAKLSGILNTNLLAEGSTPAGYGTEVFPQINAQYHEHFFTLRIDPEIDGNKNTVAMVDVVPVDALSGSSRNPYGNGFTTKTKVLRTAGEARTDTDPRKSRTWVVRNDDRWNKYSKGPVGWKLLPWNGPKPSVKKDSVMYDISAYHEYSTWVTRYEEGELYPAGFYNDNRGLVEWVGKEPGKKVEDEDVVLWFNFGLAHVPKTEDYPVMAVESCGIMLKPSNFFLENPALDVPPPGSRPKVEL